MTLKLVVGDGETSGDIKKNDVARKKPNDITLRLFEAMAGPDASTPLPGEPFDPTRHRPTGCHLPQHLRGPYRLHAELTAQASKVAAELERLLSDRQLVHTVLAAGISSLELGTPPDGNGALVVEPGGTLLSKMGPHDENELPTGVKRLLRALGIAPPGK